MNDIPFGEEVEEPSPPESAGGGIPMGEEIPFGEEVKPDGLAGDNPSAESDDSFLGTLKNPMKLWTEESIPAHLISAYKKSTFDKSFKEIIKSSAEETSETVKNLKVSKLVDVAKKSPGMLSEFVDVVKKHPGKMLGELVNTVVADPYLLLPIFWEGLGGRLGAAGLRIAGKAGQVAGRMTEIGGTLGAVGGVESAAKQLDDAGFIDTTKLANDMKTSAAFGAALGGVLTVGGLMLKLKPSDIAAIVQEKVDDGMNISRAIEEALKESGASGKKARSLVDEFEAVAKDHPELEADFKKMRKEIAPLVPPEAAAGMTPATARKDLGRMADELKAQREAGELSEGEFAKMTEELRASETGNRTPMGDDFTQMMKGISDGVPSPKGTEALPKAALSKDFQTRRLELERQRKVGEISENDFAKMTEELKASEVERLKPPKPEAPSTEPFRDESAIERAAALERVKSGEAKGFSEEPSSLAAKESILNAKRSLTPSQAKELADIKHFREVLPELGIEPRVADAMTPKEAKAWMERRLPEAPMETFVKAEAPKILKEPERAPVRPSGVGPEGTDAFDVNAFKRMLVEKGQAKVVKRRPVKGVFKDIENTIVPKEGESRIMQSEPSVEEVKAFQASRPPGESYLEATAAESKWLRERSGKPKVAEARVEAKLPPGWKERGFLDPTLAKYAAITMSGAALGGYLSDDKAKGAAIGAALFLGGPIAARAAKRIAGNGIERIKASAIGRKVGKVFEKRDPAIKGQVDEILRIHEGTVGTAKLEAARHAYAIKKLVPDAARREEILHAIQAGKAHLLTGNELEAAHIHAKMDAEMGDWGMKEGVLDHLMEEGTHISNLWKDGPKAQSLFSSMSGKSGFAHERVIPNVKMGEELGLVAKTKDVAEVGSIYMNSIAKSVANKRLLETMAGETFADGRRAVVAAEELSKMTPKERSTYGDFESVNHPQLLGAKVHPELAPSLKHFFYSNEIPAYVQAAAAVSAVSKRGLFMLSGFHVKSLADEALGIAIGLGDKNVLTKVPSMYKMIKEGKAGDFASQMVKNGMKIEPHSGIDMDNDIFRSVASSVEAIAKDLPIPGAHLPITALKKLDAGIQFTTWEYFHPSIKLSVASSMYEKALLQGDKRAPDLIQREIATAVNDLFGGVNWREVADGVQNKMLSSVAHSITTPGGLRTLRILMTAPDWTVATARAGYKGAGAVGKKLSGKPLNVREQLYMRAFLGNCVAYATIAEGLNLAFSGHHFWENKDLTYVDMGDGRKLQLNKHFMEPIHDLMDPANAIVNKLGYVPKEAAEQLLHKEYLTAKRGEQGRTSVGPEMKTNRIVHAVKGMMPIPTQQSDILTAFSGSAGLGIYGKTERQKRMEKRRDDVEKRQRERERELTKRREGKRK